jgi:hypothetical protein
LLDSFNKNVFTDDVSESVIWFLLLMSHKLLTLQFYGAATISSVKWYSGLFLCRALVLLTNSPLNMKPSFRTRPTLKNWNNFRFACGWDSQSTMEITFSSLMQVSCNFFWKLEMNFWCNLRIEIITFEKFAMQIYCEIRWNRKELFIKCYKLFLKAELSKVRAFKKLSFRIAILFFAFHFRILPNFRLIKKITNNEKLSKRNSHVRGR